MLNDKSNQQFESKTMGLRNKENKRGTMGKCEGNKTSYNFE